MTSDIVRVKHCRQEEISRPTTHHNHYWHKSLHDLLIHTVQQRKVSPLQRKVVRKKKGKNLLLQELNHNFPQHNLKTKTSSLLRCKHSSLAKIHLFLTRRLSSSKTMNLQRHRKRSVDWSNHTLQTRIKVLSENTMRTESQSSSTYSSLRVKPI